MDYKQLEIIHDEPIEVERYIPRKDKTFLEEIHTDQSVYCSNWLRSKFPDYNSRRDIQWSDLNIWILKHNSKTISYMHYAAVMYFMYGNKLSLVKVGFQHTNDSIIYQMVYVSWFLRHFNSWPLILRFNFQTSEILIHVFCA